MSPFVSFWTPAAISTNELIFLNILGALVLGLALGFERNYHGHAAGMRTYALVCVSSAAVTAIGGFPAQWFGGPGVTHGTIAAEATHVIQGIVTGIGFLGAGVIMKEGFTVRGLSTAASIWATAVIGIIVGIGFYAAAILTTVLTMVLMSSFKRLELRLPHRRQMRASVTYDQAAAPPPADLTEHLQRLGYLVLELSCQSVTAEKHFTYDLVLLGDGSHNFNDLIGALGRMEGLAAYSVAPMRD